MLPGAAYIPDQPQERQMENPFDVGSLFSGRSVTPVEAISKIVLAGARSLGLAVQVLVHCEDIREKAPERAKALRGLAQAVIEDWGIDMEGRARRQPAEGQAPLGPTPEPAPISETLHWPPPPPVLPDVYRENYYHVRESVDGVALLEGDDVLHLDPEAKLRFTGSTRWEEGVGWWLRVAVSPELTTWVLHTKLKPGDEIPQEQLP